MTLQSSSGICEEVAISGPSSTSTSSTDVYPLPLSLGRKEIHLDDEEKIVVTDVGHSKVASPGASVTINDSPYARVGDHTAFNGDVTIIQYISSNELPSIQNGAVIEEVECNGTVRVIPPPPPTPPPKPSTAARIFKRHFKSIMILLTTMTVICAITLIALRFVGTKKTSYIPTTTDDESSNTTTNIPPAKTQYFFNMSQWGGRILHNENLMDEPVQLVIIKHTKSKACRDVPNCFAAMQDMQNSDVGSHHLPDIRYNFVIGGDGNIYEGRGWGVQNEQMNNTIDIAYMGNFNEDIPSEFVVGAGKFLVKRGLLSGHLDSQNIAVVCHNQTEKTDSPGENLYKEIILWEYYSNKTFIASDWKNDL